MDINGLKQDLDELKKLESQSVRQRIKDILAVARQKLETDLSNLEAKIKKQENENLLSASSPKLPQQPRRYLVELTEYAWDQSDKFVKIFVTLDGVQKLTDAEVNAYFTVNSLKLTIKNLNNRDYCLTINNLLSPIVIDKSYKKIKTDMIAVYMKKSKEAEKWSHLTSTEKRVKDIKDAALKPENDPDEMSADPSAGIMNLMKKMYESGDAETKRTIAKAWTESQEKKNMGV